MGDEARVWRGRAEWSRVFDKWMESNHRLSIKVVTLPASDYDALVEQLAVAKAENERLRAERDKMMTVLKECDSRLGLIVHRHENPQSYRQDYADLLQKVERVTRK